ncbi:unnamed protein product [Heligmosomoides polygyrus]|uniref:N-acetyltransferase domain-containing protein n=1 Tax=Heligmosomoides polygyrus TaxID=6339 RepID=A0A183GS11_HELPZ|nr:unnamed protein product [Heligmosomoides polygyrus]
MEQQGRFLVQEIDNTSPLRSKCLDFCKEELSDRSVIIAEIDSFSGWLKFMVFSEYPLHSGAIAESIVGVCSQTPAGRFLRLKVFVEEVEKTREGKLGLHSLCGKALITAQDRFAELIVVTETSIPEYSNIEELGFMKTETEGEDYVFPPPYSALKKYCEETIMCKADDRDAVSVFLRKIMCFEFVPLVYLRRLMSVEKVGESILRTFVSAAMKVQKLQMTQIRFEDAREMVNEEALLLDYAWERLNTGHFSEVDECWRIVFAATSLLKAVRLALAGQYLNAIAAVDLGLIMGDCIPDQLLQRYALFLDTCLPRPPKIAGDEVDV